MHQFSNKLLHIFSSLQIFIGTNEKSKFLFYKCNLKFETIAYEGIFKYAF